MSKSNKTNAAYHAWKKFKQRLKSDNKIRLTGGSNPVEDTTWSDAIKTGRRHGLSRKFHAGIKVKNRRSDRQKGKEESLHTIQLEVS